MPRSAIGPAPGFHDGSKTVAVVKEAMLKVISGLGGLGCSGEDCGLAPIDCDAFNVLIVEGVLASGYHAGFHDSTGRYDGKITDQIAVCQVKGADPFACIWDGWHTGGFQDGPQCRPAFPHVAPAKSYEGAWVIDPSARIEGQPNGLVACPPPTDYNVGISIRSLAGVVPDATPAARNREYCSTVWHCPGPNCHEGFQVGCELGPHGSDQRNTCELIYGPWIWTLDGEPLQPHEGPFAVWLPRGTAGVLRICSSIGNICAERVLTGQE